MTRKTIRGAIALIALALLTVLATPTVAGDFIGKQTYGGNELFVSPECPAKKLPTFESLVPVPNIIDPFEQDNIAMFCQFDTLNEGQGVKKVKGKFETELIVFDHSSGTTETFPIKTGTFKTDKSGSSGFDFELPAELFADGFESGDVSAWSYTRTDFTNKKRVNQVRSQCGAGASRSD